ncbi:MAG: Rab family GTPase [Candidatus Helarchaeota archaeon]
MTELAIKTVVVGDEAVGKTSIIIRYVKNRFTEEYKKTLGADFALKKVQYNENLVKMYIWDIGGKIQYKNLHEFYFEGANLFIIVFDLTRYFTFENAKNVWLEDIRAKFPKVPIIFVGNKNDLKKERRISKQEIENILPSTSLVFETSAKTGEHITDLFQRIPKILGIEGSMDID